jgi:hypothetical protein
MTSTESHTTPPAEANPSTAAASAIRGAHEPVAPLARRRPGRPLEMSADEVLRTIREFAAAEDGLFRVHLVAPALYARARRLFGSWSVAVRGAGVDYAALQGAARARSLQTRRRRRRASAARRVGAAR